MYAQARKLAADSLTVMSLFVLSRVLGLVRNVVVAQQFGTGRDYEAFIAALTIPDLVFQILAGGAVGSAFIPVFKGYFSRDDDEGAWRLTSLVMTMALVITIPVLIVLAIFARPLAEVIGAGLGSGLEGSDGFADADHADHPGHVRRQWLLRRACSTRFSGSRWPAWRR